MPTMQQTIKQQPGDGRCVACTAAMAAGDETTKAFEEFVSTKFGIKTAPYSDIHAYAYLLERGLVVGLGFTDPKFDSCGFLKMTYNSRAYPAYVVVKSSYQDRTHAIYWDGRQFRDPDPHTRDGHEFNHYKILQWVPIYRIE